MSVVVDHFTHRAGHYDASSRWCTDPKLAEAMVDAVQPAPGLRMLDVACGTGLVSRHFKGKVAELVGLDLTPAMFAQAAPYVDKLVEGDATDMPFEDASFDRIICRQGIQFMDDAAAAREMVRVSRPGARIVLVHLAAYGPEDRDEYFEILRLRNPARRNFYLPGDVPNLLRAAGCTTVEARRYVSDEDVDAWADNRAIEDKNRSDIREVYRRASPAFLALHGVRSEEGHWFDRMLFEIAIGVV